MIIILIAIVMVLVLVVYMSNQTDKKVKAKIEENELEERCRFSNSLPNSFFGKGLREEKAIKAFIRCNLDGAFYIDEYRENKECFVRVTTNGGYEHPITYKVDFSAISMNEAAEDFAAKKKLTQWGWEDYERRIIQGFDEKNDFHIYEVDNWTDYITVLRFTNVKTGEEIVNAPKLPPKGALTGSSANRLNKKTPVFYQPPEKIAIKENIGSYSELLKGYLDAEHSEYPVHEFYEKMLRGDIYAGLRYAKCALDQGDWEECLNVLEKMEATNKITDEGWLQVRWILAGECYWADDLRKAIECFENAYELHSEEALWALLECMCRAKELEYSWKMNDAQMTKLEEKALEGDGELSFRIGQSYMVQNNHARGKLFFMNARKYLNDESAHSVKIRFFLWWLDEKDENGTPYDPDVLRDELQQEVEKGDPSCEYYIDILETKLRRDGGAK